LTLIFDYFDKNFFDEEKNMTFLCFAMNHRCESYVMKICNLVLNNVYRSIFANIHPMFSLWYHFLNIDLSSLFIIFLQHNSLTTM